MASSQMLKEVSCKREATLEIYYGIISVKEKCLWAPIGRIRRGGANGD